MKITEFETLVSGNISGDALISSTPLSFWGGVKADTGDIIDIHHELVDTNITGKVLCIPFDRGSCSGSGVMLEMLRLGTHPAALLCVYAEPVLALGSLIGQKMYGRSVAIRTISRELFEKLPGRACITFTDDAILAE